MQRSAYGQGSTHGQQPGGDTYGSSVPTAYMYASPVPPRENKDPWLFDQDGRIFHSGAPWMGLDFPQRRRIAKQQDVDGAHRWEYNLHGNAARLHGSTLEHGLPRQSITYTEHSSEQACLSSTHKTAAPHTVSEDRDPGHGPPSDSDRRSDDPMWDLADDTDLEEDVQGISSSDAAHCHAVIGREPVRTSLSTNDENMGVGYAEARQPSRVISLVRHSESARNPTIMSRSLKTYYKSRERRKILTARGIWRTKTTPRELPLYYLDKIFSLTSDAERDDGYQGYAIHSVRAKGGTGKRT